eukprot:353449-Chlamydomonas_euryale.AAC.4
MQQMHMPALAQPANKKSHPHTCVARCRRCTCPRVGPPTPTCPPCARGSAPSPATFRLAPRCTAPRCRCSRLGRACRRSRACPV